ncbi:cysteine desulfurase family protein [[Limnothrix rosea] IAM M-220]|uniref:cysteine desulfurase family protein n=1 Tax=[Limnothrix rosea] IAM M-220 TaxID=454133 RepID=UPI0009696E71|nr:aminotransferase class V-fold PLP-dependent enzyme [[Limnothrix rosea] IAM M-220]OKH12924.1 IscS subfamily cysteine desulfurase [[Limnothrix rosea] IAM M-220]
MKDRPIYLDNHATTPVDPLVLEAMLPYFTENFGNAGSAGHSYGWEAAAAVKQAREAIAQSINAAPEEIIFTSGATESNNLALKGIAEAYFSQGRHIITVQTEHRAVLDPCAYLETLGFEVTYLPVQPDGLLELDFLEKAIRPDTVLVSVMAANNEIGVLQPIDKIGAICHEKNVLFHCDAAQAIAKAPIDVQAQNIDLLSLTAHKIYGPKGIGALYVRRKNPRVNLAAQLHGGGQEREKRSGTLYVPQIVGFGKAVEIALANQPEENERLKHLRDRLWNKLQNIPNCTLNGDFSQRLPHNLNISFADIDGASLLLGLRHTVALSSGSACSSGKPSHVLQAIGRTTAECQASLRFGIGRTSTIADIDQVAIAVQKTVTSLRQMSAD